MGALKVLLGCCIFVVFMHEKNYVRGTGISELNKSSSEDDIVQASLSELKDIDEDAFKKLEKNPEKKKAVIKAMQNITKTQMDIEKSLADDPEPDDLEGFLKKHLSPNRMETLKGGLKIPSFKLTLTKQQDGMFSAAYTSDVMTFKKGSQVLRTKSDISLTKIKQWASITYEVVMLIVSAIGARVDRPSTTKKVLEQAEASIQELAEFRQALTAFQTAWADAKDNKFEKAKAMYQLIKKAYQTGIFSAIIRAVKDANGALDKVKTVARVIGFLAASFANGGASLTAEIAYVVDNAADFAKKLTNMKTLDSIRYLK